MKKDNEKKKIDKDKTSINDCNELKTPEIMVEENISLNEIESNVNDPGIKMNEIKTENTNDNQSYSEKTSNENET